MKYVKKILAFLLAAFLIFSSAAVAIQVNALTTPVLGNTSGAKVTGTPNIAVYDAVGIYDFTVLEGTGVGVLNLKIKKPDGTYKEVPNLTSASEIVYGDLIFATLNGNDWAATNSFSISITEGSTSGSAMVVFSRLTKYTSTGKNDDPNGTQLSVISKGGTANLFFTVVDTSNTQKQVESASVIFEQGSFRANSGVNTGGSDSVFIANKVGDSLTEKATFNIIFTRMRYTGTGNTVRFTVNYRVTGGQEYSATYTATLSECNEYVASTDKEEEEEKALDPLIPYVIVSNYNYGDSSVTAGGNFDLELKLTNTSPTYTLENVIMSVNPTGVFSLVNSSNTVYIPNLMADQSMERLITIYTGLTAVTTNTANAINISFKYQYVANEKRISGESSESITIPVTFPDRFELTQPELPDTIYAGDQFSLYLPFVNKGRNSIFNLTAELTGIMTGSSQKIYVGNLEAGKEDAVDFAVNADTPGEISGKVLFTYEDANMKKCETSVPFTLNVLEYQVPVDLENPEDSDPGTEIPTDAKVDGNFGKTIGFCSLLVCAMSAYITIKNIKAKRSEMADEDI